MRIEDAHEVFGRLVHTDEKAAGAVDAFAPLNNKITFETVDLIYDQVPATKVEIADTKIDALNATISDDVVKPLLEFHVYVVIYICHAK